MPPQRKSDRLNGAAHRALRERSGYNIATYVKALATQADQWVNSQHISNIEADRRNPGPELLDAMTHVLGVPRAALLRCPGCPGCRDQRDDGSCPICEAVAEQRVATLKPAA